MNRLELAVENRSAFRVDHGRLGVRIGAHSGLSEEFALDGGESRVVGVPFGGYADLQDIAQLVTTLSIAPHDGELVEISRSGEVEVEDSTLRLQVLNEELTRGGTGRVRFVLENTGEEEIELLTATNSGASPSSELTFTLKDPDGNVLSSKGYRQSLGSGVVTLANGATVARIQPGSLFTSEPVELPVPLSAPDRVIVRMDVAHTHFHLGKPEHTAMDGISGSREVTLIDTPYSGEVTAVSPESSNGDRDIEISGVARERATGLLVGEVPLKLVISVNGFERSHTVLTDADGRFTFTFIPLPSECGRYTVFAVHPDVLDKPSQAEFTIHRLTITPRTLNLGIPKNFEKTVSLQVSTGDGTRVSNVHLSCEEADQPNGAFPPGVHVTVGPSIAALGSRQSGSLVFSVWADNSAGSTSALIFQLESDEKGEGSWATITVNLSFSDSQPALFVTPNHMETGVSLGGTASESLTLENRGLADLNEVSLTLLSADGSPAPPWVHLHSESSQGNMAVGEKRPIGLSFTPTAENAEGNHVFYLRVTSANYRKTDIPLFVTVTQSGIGNALFKVSDIYTGTLDSRGQVVQGLSGATLTVQNEEVPTIQKTLSSDALGEALFTGLPAGRYKVRTTAPNHQENIGRLWVKPGLTMSEPVFLAYNLVTVEWEVVETTIRDKYEIVLKATFETNVPAPVVVAEPSSVHLPKMKAGEVYHGELALTNYGLIQAINVEFAPPDGQDDFHYELLTPVPPTLNARERVTIPFRITCLHSFDQVQDEGGDGGRCEGYVSWGELTYDYVCASGTTVGSSYPTCVIHEVGVCKSKPSLPGSSGPSGDGDAIWFFSYSGSGGTEGPKPSPSPQPIKGLRCWPKAARMEEWTGLRDQCVPETKQDILQEVGSSVNCLLREYNDGASDLSVKALGANVSVLRTFYGDRWHFEDQRHNLKFIMDSLGQTIQYIDKGGVLYERSSLTSSSPLFTHGTYRITQTAGGYLWEDKLGNWRSFDTAGKMAAYGTPNGILTTLVYDAGENGRLAGLSDRDGRQVIWFEYDPAGSIAAVRDLDGRRVEYGYTGGRLTSVRDVLGNTTTYAYDEKGRMLRKTDPLGRRETIVYDRYGDVSTVVDGEGHGHGFRFDYDKGRAEYYAQIRTPSGMVKEVWYDRNGDTRRVDVNGRTTRKIVKDGRHLIITDEAGNVTRKEFDDRTNLTRIVHPDGSTVSHEYDHKLNRPVKVTDERGSVTQYAYDHIGNLILKTEAVGTDSERTTHFAYDGRGNVVSIRGGGDENTREAEALLEYDGSGNLLSITEPEGAVTRFTHDSIGNVLTRTDPGGKVFAFTYDDAGRMTSAVDPLGHKTELFHDAVGNRTRVIDAEEKTTDFEYDAHNRLVKVIDAAGGTTLYTYDAAGMLIRRTDAEGKILDYEYDSRGRLTAAVDGNGNVVRVEYAESSGCSTCKGGFDEPARIVTPTFAKEFRYDSRGRKIEEKEVLSETESTVTLFQYDRGGNLTAVVDRDSRTTRYGYDALGRLTEVDGPLGKVAQYLYDDRDSLIALVDANGNRMRFEYDRNNRLIREIRPMGQETSYQYDGRSLLVRQADPKNQVAFYDYDDAGRLEKLRTYGSFDHTNPVKTVSFVHDRVGNLKSYDDGLSSARYEYDDAYRKIHEAVSYGPFELSSTTSWYRNGRKRSFTGPDGVAVGYDYDGNNQLAGIEIPGSGLITYNQYSWFSPTRITLPGGTTRETTYDPLMRLQTLQVKDPAGTLLLGAAHSYDRMGRLVSRKTEDADQGYGYDELHRLIKADRTNRQPENFSYDRAGNRLSADDVRGSWSYNSNHELQGHGATTFTYDRNGNTEEQVSGGETLRTIHNVEDQLERVERGDGAVISEYGYDPFGRRLWKDVGGRRTFFFYADEGLVGEYDAAGGEIRSYGYRPGSAWTTDPLFMKKGAEIYFYQNDHLGTPIMLTTAGGRVVWSATYTVFGEAEVAPLSSVTNNLRFAGQYYDHETGLHYNYHRTYHPGLGRYLERDPLGAAGGPNPYAYVLDPTNGIDPLGLFAISWGGVGEGMAETAVGMAIGAAAVGAAILLAPAVIVAIPCVVVSSVAVVGAGYLGWRTGQVITGDRIDFSLSDWQFHVRRMCDDERSRMLGEVLVEWGTFGLSALKGLNFCFAAGTPVLTDGGLIPIERIRVGDRVLSRDEKTGEVAYRQVARVFETPNQPVYELRLSNAEGDAETFHATGDHPFYVRHSGWTRAVDLLPGDEIFTSLGGWLKVSGGTWTDRRTTVYNLEVDGTHTYFVGQLQAWVHNMCVGVEANGLENGISKAWKSLIEGKAHGIIPHKIRTYREAIRMAKSGEYERVYVNRSLKTSTEGKILSALRPDVAGVLKSGKLDVIEVPSPSQTPSAMMEKILHMEDLLGMHAGPGSAVSQIR
jgi:RHS repeat-associated protein